MGALGYVMQVPEDEKYLQTKDEIIDDIIVSLGGRAAEEVIFNTVTTGAENDIEKATSMARSMITMFGMSDKFGLMQLESVQNRYLDGNRVLNCSDQTAAQVDEEVKKLLAECYDRAKRIIREHLDSMDKIAQFLIEKETITGKEFMKIYREVENIPEPTEEEMEQAKRGRIYATRAESALVGENVPIKSKKEEPKEEPTEAAKEESVTEPGADDAGDSNSGISGDTTGSTFEATVSDEGTQTSTGGGRFSHVPEDFDKN
jgi:cell division protease FtsH